MALSKDTIKPTTKRKPRVTEDVAQDEPATQGCPHHKDGEQEQARATKTPLLGCTCL